MIHRSPRPKSNYTNIDNSIFDLKLTAEALGVFCYLLSRPDNWKVLPAQLAFLFGLGKHRLYRILGELKIKGVVKAQKKADGQVHYHVFDQPIEKPNPENQDKAQKPNPENPDQGFPDLGFQDALPITERSTITNRQQLRKEEALPAEASSPKGGVLPSFWEPSESDRDYGHQLGLSDHQIDDLAEEMRLWAGANRNRSIAKKADWSLTFKGWMRRDSKRFKPKKKETMLDLRDDLYADIQREIDSGLRHADGTLI